MEKIIKELQLKWQAVKADAARCEGGKGNADLAAKLDDCRMFNGDESIDELSALMFSPQGVEFLTRYKFPDLAVFRKFKRFSPERLGVYIDAGRIALKNPEKAFLVGNTVGVLEYDELKAKRLVMMHGAKATVEASGWAVVSVVTDGTCEVEVKKDGHAKVMT